MPYKYVCPNCNKIHLRREMFRYNYHVRNLYSDSILSGRLVTNISKFSRIARCANCKAYFILDRNKINKDSEIQGFQNHTDTNELKIHTNPKTQSLRSDDTPIPTKVVDDDVWVLPFIIDNYIEFFNVDFALTEDEELGIRLDVWRLFNKKLIAKQVLSTNYGLSFMFENSDNYVDVNSLFFDIRLLFNNAKEEEFWERNLRRVLILLQPEKDEDRLVKAEIYRNLGEFDNCRQMLETVVDETNFWIVSILLKECERMNRCVVSLEKKVE